MGGGAAVRRVPAGRAGRRCGFGRSAVLSGFALLLAAALVLVVLLRDLLKRCCLAVCSIFNDTIKLDGLVFCWSLINTFKDLRRVNLWRLLLNTVLMWGAYLASYAVLGQAIIACGGAGGSFGLVEVFNMLFGVKSVDVTSLGVAGSLGLSDAARGLVIAWFLLPLAVMFAAPLLPEHLRAALNGAAEPIANRETGQENYLNLLPQVDPRDRGAFLNQYFSLQNKAYVAKFIEINQNITICRIIPPVPTQLPCCVPMVPRPFTANTPLARTVPNWPNSWPGCAATPPACRCAKFCARAPAKATAGMI